MKKIFSVIFGIILLSGQSLIYQPASAQTDTNTRYLESEPGLARNTGTAGTIPGFEITNVSKNPVKDLGVPDSYVIVWQKTPQIETDIATNQLQSFSLFRSNYATKDAEILVGDKINKNYYYTYDNNVASDIQPSYRIVANYANGQILTTPVYTFGIGNSTTPTGNLNYPNNTTNTSPVSATPIIDPNGNPNLAAIEESSGSGFDVPNFVQALFSGFSATPGSNIGYNQKITGFSNIPSDFLDKIGISNISNVDLQDAYDEANSMFGADLTQGELAQTVLRRNSAVIEKEKLPLIYRDPLDKYSSTEEGKRASAAGGELNGGNQSGSDSGVSSDTGNATDSANYFLKNLSGINVINMQCSQNTGILCVVEKVVMLGLSLAGLIAVVFIIYGGYLYITSAGNPEGAKAGMTAVTNAAIGLVIILAAWIIVNTVLTFISGGTIGA